ncbi:hypothetical protein BDW42DRAFT_115618 [Aspergillus taichungensis]|uniref:Uncharacterized protein n=1 Tax=Aspergillus taichungensis TaxID=482145 RepID=A0A2J5HSA1_9EURO|nr:hypothetical protein BDW42DRAFT_115618 [Aspergillus taichungensis]
MESRTSHEICRLRCVTDELLQENERLRRLLSSTSNVRRCGECSREIDGAEVPKEDISFDPDSVRDDRKNKTIDIDSVDRRSCPSPAIPFGPSTDLFRETDSPHIMPLGEPDSMLLLPEVLPHPTASTTDVENFESSQNTTVCAVALELVMSCNRKNLSISELDMRLRCGYRRAQFQWEGCRVDNRVLFAVLSEIT